MVCRSESWCTDATRLINDEIILASSLSEELSGSSGLVIPLVIDLVDLQSVRSFATDLEGRQDGQCDARDGGWLGTSIQPFMKGALVSGVVVVFFCPLFVFFSLVV